MSMYMYHHIINLNFFTFLCTEIWKTIIRKMRMGFLNDLRDRALQETCLSE